MELSVNAVEAAVCVAERFGLSVEEPVLLRSTNNVVAWLRPSMIVAKIGVGPQRGFHTEVSVASELGAHSYTVALDTRLLETCRDLVRVKTAAWCWADVDRGDLRQHAEMHLTYLKKRFIALRPA